ncbi:hypothetical protein BGZ65_000384 [Modicella reniformis]|uniref:Translation initiation factor 3 N-terminal domain-containing protein n=1 Tax=Modicella reniformis TaxID=1440133 RepID=A0A9P6J2P9_9FUNG|nr:hypothetical protein BGZ65_000384 [Modicella reniformis]
MIPIRRTAFILLRSCYSAHAVSYSTRSSGATFLNSLDFLAPSQKQQQQQQQHKQRQQQKIPSSFLDSGFNQQWQQPRHINENESLKGVPSLKDDLDDLDGPLSDRDNLESSKRAQGNNIIRSRALSGARRDEEIDSQWIQYISLEGNMGVKRLSNVLNSIDRSKFFLLEVDSSADPPICKLTSKRAHYQKAKAEKQAKKVNVISTKELQLNWGTDPHDLDHKLVKFRGFLEKGYRVEVHITGKKGKSTTPEEREVIFERVKTEFESVAKYVKQAEWINPTAVSMILHGITNKKKQQQQRQQHPL